MTHMDTVPLCAGAKPKRQGRKDRQHGKDGARRRQSDRLRRSCDFAAELVRQKLDHPPITLLFCVREESGLGEAAIRSRRPRGP